MSGSSVFVIAFEPDKLIEGLEELKKPHFLAPAHEDLGRNATANLEIYPPLLPNQVYRRTEKLGKSWAFVARVNLFSVTTVVGNNTPYARKVQDDERQEWIHRGRWRTVQQELVSAKEYAPAIVKDAVVARMRELFS
jgi:hypothetical protein